jgi:hypothetical protein
MHIFSDIKLYPWPLFIVYDPGSYLVKGRDARQAIDTVKPGDILLRRYRRYVDGYFIPGYFSHAALYIGPVGDDDINLVQGKSGKQRFRSGRQMVIHALAQGVLMEDLLSFCRCDQMAILRFPDTIQRTSGLGSLEIKQPAWNDQEEHIYERLNKDDQIAFKDEAFPVIRKKALGYVGRSFDFGIDFEFPERICCTELLYWCTKSLYPFLRIEPKRERLVVLRKSVILPDTFLDTQLQPVWCSASNRDDIRQRFP